MYNTNTKLFKRFFSLLLAMTIAVIVSIPVSAASSNAVKLSKGYYLIKSVYCDKYLDISNGSSDNNANVQIWALREDQPSRQIFFLEPVGDFWKITNFKTKKVISVLNSSTENGAAIVQYEDSNDASQLWDIIKNYDGTYSFANKKSGEYMDISGGNSANGTELLQWFSHGGQNQKFGLETVIPDSSNSYNYSKSYEDEDEEIWDDVDWDEEDEEEWDEDYHIYNQTNYNFDMKNLPKSGQKYLAKAEFMDRDTVREAIENKNSVALTEAAQKGRSNGSVNRLIRLTYVTFNVTYKNNSIYISEAQKKVQYQIWTKKNQSKVDQISEDWTIFEVI